MATKRMISMKIVDSDAFLEMPLSTQCLYFHLNMRADDDGFVGNPKKIMRMIQATEDDLKILLAKHFLIMFEDSVVVIKHWWIHNTLAKDRYSETSYIDDKAQLYLKKNKAYTLNPSEADKLAIEERKEKKVLLVEQKSELETVEKDAEKVKKTKHKNGTYQNVLLTDDELSKLEKELTQQKAESVINYFSELKEMKGYKYKSDYLAIKKWGIRAYDERHVKKGGVVNEQFRTEEIVF